jgi:hypothetical protein
MVSGDVMARGENVEDPWNELTHLPPVLRNESEPR